MEQNRSINGRGAADSFTAGQVRLYVVLAQRSSQELTSLADQERLTRSTVVDRAVQLYAALRRWQSEGAELYISRPGSDELDSLTVEWTADVPDDEQEVR